MNDEPGADFEQWVKDNMVAMPEVRTVVSSDISTGLSKREHIATLCLQGILANKVYMATLKDKKSGNCCMVRRRALR